MSPVSISPALISLASSECISKAQANFKAAPVANWLAPGHPAEGGQLLKVSGRPARNLTQAKQRLSDQNFVEAIAASAPNHCIDGWSFLSRSFASLISRDIHAARHFAYYAQLRAALSILSFSGVGIFNGVNVLIDKAGAVHDLGPGGTHKFVWPALEAWIKQDEHAKTFLKALTLQGQTFLDCMQAIYPSKQATAAIGPILKTWSLNLIDSNTHHDQRNISSYAPHGLNSVPSSTDDDIRYIAETWRLLQPSTSLGFDEVDIHLLRDLLQQIHEADHAATGLPGSVDFSNSPIAARLTELPHQVRMKAAQGFFTADRSVTEPAIIRLAKGPAQDPLSMISRAVLLLRAAVGFANLSFADKLTPSDGDLNAWLEPFMISRGLADASHIPELKSELWDEINSALEDFAESPNAQPNNPYALMSNPDLSLPILTQFERACVWGICP